MMPRNYIFIIALILLSSFIVHAIDFDHDHPAALFGTDHLQAALHGEDRKIWAILVSVLSVLLFSARNRLVGYDFLQNESEFPDKSHTSLIIYNTFNPIRIAFRRGIIQKLVYD